MTCHRVLSAPEGGKKEVLGIHREEWEPLYSVSKRFVFHGKVIRKHKKQ